jgi:signal transduction histidine kinase
MRVALTLVEDARTDNERADYLARMADEIQRLDGLIENILRYARLTQSETPERTRVDLVSLLEPLLESAELEARGRDIEFRYQGPDSLSLEAHPELLERALENLLRNAIAHAPDQSRVDVILSPDAEGLELHVLDRGPGVPEDKLSAIFEPFLRLTPERSEQGQSGGIGLAIVRKAVEKHGGEVSASNRKGGGLDVTVRLPRSDEAP